MFEILEKKWLSDKICLMEVKAKELSYSAKPGHFVIVKTNQKSERVPLTICDYNHDRKSITLVYQILGKSTLDMSKLKIGERFQDISGPLGHYSEFIDAPLDELKNKKFLFIGGGVGIAPVYPQLKWMSKNGVDFDVILGARDQSLLILEKEIRKFTNNVYVCTDDGSLGLKGNVVDMMKQLVEEDGKSYDHVVSIGPLPMMKFSALKAKEYNFPVTVSLNPLMIDGTGMCGACRVTIGKEVKFACVDGPEFDGALVDFDEAIRRQNMYKTEEGRSMLKASDGYTHHAKGCGCEHDKSKDDPHFDRKKAVPMREYEPEKRVKNFVEVSYGYNVEEAVKEASRCLECRNPKCREGCPVNIDIPGFIKELKVQNLKGSAEVLGKYTLLPAVCGRVCPQETQCEEKCVVGIKNEPVKIGRLERFVGDWMLDNYQGETITEKKNKKVAVIGSGPAGLTAASELAKKGYSVTVYEALHELGGVLTYGIPEFRLPKDLIVRREIEKIQKLGV
ncbi:MAG: sulfide/dihydroorotate dehydrogenase-like FAD/NAD-binding protein, partial [Fusobacteriaceae bacterium]|nr:sulfide/dihydroorotate dehydrogenase-like FAD/NAD-binding protein [Fusobacteriaceae bacterium]